MEEIISRSLVETEKIAADWLEKISAGREKASEALVVGLSGQLGAGKTAFVKLVAQKLGLANNVTSPTFVLMKIYPLSRKEPGQTVWDRLVHIDAYRLSGPDEMKVLGLDELKKDPRNLILIEWPENVGLTDDKLNVQVKIKTQDDQSRVFRFEF